MTIDNNLRTTDLLLGKLPEEKRARIEQQFFADQALFDELLIAENELTDAYVAGRLTSEDQMLFEQRFLLNARQRRRAIFADALTKYASREKFGDVPVRERELSGFWTSLTSLFSIRPLLVSFATGLVLVLVSIFVLINRPGKISEMDVAQVQVPEAEAPAVEYREPEQPASTKSEKAAVGNTDLVMRKANTNAAPTLRPATFVSTIFLNVGSTRGSGGPKTYSIPENATDVRLRLAIEDSRYTSYIAVVETVEGKQIASQKASRKGESVSILLPASHLKKGDYIVTLKGTEKGLVPETISEYSFTVN